MNYLYEYSDILNTPYEAFEFDTLKNDFPVRPHFHHYVEFIYMLEGIGIVWFVFLAFSGLCVIHEYGLFKNIASLLATAVSAFLIVFLAVLFLTLEEKMFGFLSDIIREFIRRM